MIRDFGSIARNKVEIKEGAIVMLQGVDTDISIQVDGSNAITNEEMSLFEGVRDVSGTKLSGTMKVNGRRITTQTFTGLRGGLEYAAAIFFKDGGVGTSRLVNIHCLKYGVSPSNYQQSDFLRYRLDESPIMVLPGQSFPTKVAIAGYGEISNPSMSIYQGTSNKSSSLLSGSMSISGREITLKTIANLVGGNRYLVYMLFQDDGKNTWRYAELICPKVGS